MSIFYRIPSNTLKKPDKIPASVIAKVRDIESGKVRRGKKEMLTLRIDPDVIASYRALGEGWQAAMNEDLRKARGL